MLTRFNHQTDAASLKTHRLGSLQSAQRHGKVLHLLRFESKEQHYCHNNRAKSWCTRKAARSFDVAESVVGAFSQAMARRSSASSSLKRLSPHACFAAATACASPALTESDSANL